jgi:hypothetical protein
MLGHTDDYMAEQCENMAIIDPQPPGKSPGLLPKRGIRFLVGGLIGGTLIVTCISFAIDDWTYLYRWLSGLAVVVMVFVYVFCKKWLARRAIHLVKPNVPPRTKESHLDKSCPGD